jgi:hypothetical protein
MPGQPAKEKLILGVARRGKRHFRKPLASNKALIQRLGKQEVRVEPVEINVIES